MSSNKSEKKDIGVITIEFEEYTEEDYKDAATYYIKNALGQRIYFQTKDRAKAQTKCDSLYGKGHYKVNTSKIEKGGNVTVRGSMNSKSSSGAKLMSIRASQGKCCH